MGRDRRIVLLNSGGVTTPSCQDELCVSAIYLALDICCGEGRMDTKDVSCSRLSWLGLRWQTLDWMWAAPDNITTPPGPHYQHHRHGDMDHIHHSPPQTRRQVNHHNNKYQQHSSLDVLFNYYSSTFRCLYIWFIWFYFLSTVPILTLITTCSWTELNWADIIAGTWRAKDLRSHSSDTWKQCITLRLFSSTSPHVGIHLAKTWFTRYLSLSQPHHPHNGSCSVSTMRTSTIQHSSVK